MLQGKTIIVGVTGGIAAYKACDLVSRLNKFGAEVWVVMTKEAAELVRPLTFRTLSGNPVMTDLFSEELSSLPVPHISLAQKASLLVIAPCTANVIGKAAAGIADDPLTTLLLAARCPKLLAPAMNCDMWNNPLVDENCRKLAAQGYNFIGPAKGKLACGDDDIGRMSESEEITQEVVRLLGGSQDLKGKHILVTAGGTREPIDAVRYISNHSSGKMGYALAGAARGRGADVTLVSANVSLPSPLDIKPLRVDSAGGMYEAVAGNFSRADVVIMAAAVADFIPQKISRSKLKKRGAPLSLELQPSRDILKSLSQHGSRKGKLLVGFALETNDLIANARLKLKEKDLDYIVANDPSSFGADRCRLSLIARDGSLEEFPLLGKSEAANRLLDRIK